LKTHALDPGQKFRYRAGFQYLCLGTSHDAGYVVGHKFYG